MPLDQSNVLAEKHKCWYDLLIEIAGCGRDVKIEAMIVCSTRTPEHVHIATKWRPAENPAAECVEKVQQEHLMLQQTKGYRDITDLDFIKWS